MNALAQVHNNSGSQVCNFASFPLIAHLEVKI